jgi:CheY-like chemotaxis protein
MILRQGDYVFDEAGDGETALRLLAEEAVDLVMLDLMMPHPNGFDVLTAMMQSERLSTIPVIVASASTSPEDVERSLRLGAVDYFMKPLTEWDIRFQLPIKVRNAIALHQASEERLRVERMKAVSAMAVALNHEINNPLQVIQGNAQLLHVFPNLVPEAREKVQRIRAATETIANITHRIAALRDVVTVDYPAGNRTTVPMVNLRERAEPTPGTPAGADANEAGVENDTERGERGPARDRSSDRASSEAGS